MYLRLLGITTLRSVVYLLLLLLGIVFIADRVSPIMLSSIYLALYFINAFVFGEWMFTGVHVRLVHLAAWIIMIFFWDAFISLLVMSWLQGSNQFLHQPFWPNALLFLINLIALSAAYYLKKRMAATRSFAEGLSE